MGTDFPILARLRQRDLELKVQALPGGLLRLSLRNRWGRLTGFWACCYRVGGMLVDSGFGHAHRLLARYLADRPPELIGLTHHHEDHSGGCGALGRPVFLRQPELRWTEGLDRLRRYRRVFWGQPAAYRPEPMPEELSAGGRRLVPIPTPGHSATTRRAIGRRIMRIGLGLVGVYLLVAAILFVFQRKLIYPRYLRDAPTEGGRGAAGLERIWRQLPGGAGRVEAWFLPGDGVGPGRPGGLVVFSHGNAELIDDWPTALARYRRWGLSVLLPEYRGYGRSAGAPSQAAITEDLGWFLEAALARPDVDPERLVYHGRSLGGGAACALAALRPPRALVLQSTFARLADLAWRFGMPPFLVLDTWDNQAVLGGLDRPVLLLHGRADDLVPFAHAGRLLAVARHARLVEQACQHNDCPPDWDAHWAEVEAFLRQAGVLREPAPQ